MVEFVNEHVEVYSISLHRYTQCLKYSDYTEAPKDLSFPASNILLDPHKMIYIAAICDKEVNIKVEERERPRNEVRDRSRRPLNRILRARICKRLRSPGIDSASLCSMAGRYDK